MSRRNSLCLLIITLTAAFAIGGQPYKPVIDPANFQSKVDNPHFPLIPGTTRKYVEKGGGETTEEKLR